MPGSSPRYARREATISMPRVVNSPAKFRIAPECKSGCKKWRSTRVDLARTSVVSWRYLRDKDLAIDLAHLLDRSRDRVARDAGRLWHESIWRRTGRVAEQRRSDR